MSLENAIADLTHILKQTNILLEAISLGVTPKPPATEAPAEGDTFPVTSPIPFPKDAPSETIVTMEDLRKALINFNKEFGKEETKNMLASYGVSKLSELPEEKWEQVFNAIGFLTFKEG